MRTHYHAPPESAPACEPPWCPPCFLDRCALSACSAGIVLAALGLRWIGAVGAGGPYTTAWLEAVGDEEAAGIASGVLADGCAKAVAGAMTDAITNSEEPTICLGSRRLNIKTSILWFGPASVDWMSMGAVSCGTKVRSPLRPDRGQRDFGRQHIAFVADGPNETISWRP